MDAPATIDPTPRLAPEAFAERAQAIEREIGRVIVGQRYLVDRLIMGLLANGHVLLEGVRPRQDAVGQDAGAEYSCELPPTPVHSRPAARRPHRHADLLTA